MNLISCSLGLFWTIEELTSCSLGLLISSVLYLSLWMKSRISCHMIGCPMSCWNWHSCTSYQHIYVSYRFSNRRCRLSLAVPLYDNDFNWFFWACSRTGLTFLRARFLLRFLIFNVYQYYLIFSTLFSVHSAAERSVIQFIEASTLNKRLSLERYSSHRWQTFFWEIFFTKL